jgi:hypothetical protein
MSGQKVNISATNGFSLADSWGAGVNGSLGGLNLSGRFVKLANMDTISSSVMLLVNTLEFIQNVGTGGATLTEKKSSQKAFNKTAFFFNYFETLVRDVEPLVDAWGAAKLKQKLNNRDPAPTPLVNPNPNANQVANVAGLAMADLEFIEVCVLSLNMVLNITDAVYTTIEGVASPIWLKDIQNSADEGDELEYSAANKSSFRDQLNLCALAVDNGIISVVMDILQLIMIGKSIPGSSGSIRVRPSGDIALNSSKFINNYGTMAQQDATTVDFIKKTTQRALTTVSVAAKIGVDIAKAVSSGVATYERVEPWLEKL